MTEAEKQQYIKEYEEGKHMLSLEELQKDQAKKQRRADKHRMTIAKKAARATLKELTEAELKIQQLEAEVKYLKSLKDLNSDIPASDIPAKVDNPLENPLEQMYYDINDVPWKDLPEDFISRDKWIKEHCSDGVKAQIKKEFEDGQTMLQDTTNNCLAKVIQTKDAEIVRLKSFVDKDSDIPDEPLVCEKVPDEAPVAPRQPKVIPHPENDIPDEVEEIVRPAKPIFVVPPKDDIPEKPFNQELQNHWQRLLSDGIVDEDEVKHVGAMLDIEPRKLHYPKMSAIQADAYRNSWLIRFVEFYCLALNIRDGKIKATGESCNWLKDTLEKIVGCHPDAEREALAKPSFKMRLKSAGLKNA